MIKETYHPNAYLSHKKNVKLGLKARTKVLNVLERTIGNAKTLAKEGGLAYGVAMYHLKLLEKEGIVSRKDHKPFEWVMTGKGQKRLDQSD